MPPRTPVSEHLITAIFHKFCEIYSSSVPYWIQRIFEFSLLIEAFICLAMLSHLHYSCIHNPINCLNLQINADDLKQDSILRIQIKNTRKLDFKNSINQLDFTNGTYIKQPKNFMLPFYEFLRLLDPIMVPVNIFFDELLVIPLNIFGYKFCELVLEAFSFANYYIGTTFFETNSLTSSFSNFFKDMNDDSIFEYSEVYGILQLTDVTRFNFNVTYVNITLNPSTMKCFGSMISRILLEELFGYGKIISLSLHEFARNKTNKGYYRNINEKAIHSIEDEMIKSRFSYINSLSTIVLYVLFVSMLTRYSFHNLMNSFFNMLYVVDGNSSINIPLYPLVIMVLAIAGFKSIMKELYINFWTGFCVFVMVWMADQYYMICCQTQISKKYWPRFFFFYFFIFYAYHQRFQGNFNSLSFAIVWLLVQHSMIYFFHHYELPLALYRLQVERIMLEGGLVNHHNRHRQMDSNGTEASINRIRERSANRIRRRRSNRVNRRRPNSVRRISPNDVTERSPIETELNGIAERRLDDGFFVDIETVNIPEEQGSIGNNLFIQNTASVL